MLTFLKHPLFSIKVVITRFSLNFFSSFGFPDFEKYHPFCLSRQVFTLWHTFYLKISRLCSFRKISNIHPLIDWFLRHPNPTMVILYQEVNESRSLYVYIFIFCLPVSDYFSVFCIGANSIWILFKPIYLTALGGRRIVSNANKRVLSSVQIFRIEVSPSDAV